ncbi:MAG: ketose-bisphosphate aldolase [Alphaproteobacteria bacterium]|nr:ketose-bisphosphate aldolase [Alphaproteobacteria bacterium]
MKYREFGLCNTENMLKSALRGNFAVPAFNAYNMETVTAIISAARLCHSPVIIAISESALKYMGGDVLMGIISGTKLTPDDQIALHLDHGSSIESCMNAINIGFSSVMLDFSKYDLDENTEATANITRFAHARNVTTEAELGELSGIEDETTFNDKSVYTDPKLVKKFVTDTKCDSLAVAIGTSHGAYKRKNADEKLRFDILEQIQNEIPYTPLVLHGASSVPEYLVDDINKFGGDIKNAIGIDQEQLRFAATKTNICKINIDSDLRLATTAAVRRDLFTHPQNFNPREYLAAGRDAVRDTCIFLIREVFHSNDKI